MHRQPDDTDDAPPEKTATCRGCGRELRGKPYYMGGSAHDPKTGKRCPVNHYGGFVCSEVCDERSSLELEQSMPGHGAQQKRIGDDAKRRQTANWRDRR